MRLKITRMNQSDRIETQIENTTCIPSSIQTIPSDYNLLKDAGHVCASH